jgi:hypothetical protein
MIKKQWGLALVLYLLIPLVWMLGGALFNQINPEAAAGHPNYVQNYHRLHLLKNMSLWASAVVMAVLWMLVCFMVIRARKRSYLWIFLAALGPFGFAVLATLNDRAPADADRYARFVRDLNWLVRAGYELCTFVVIWVLAYEAIVLKRTLIIRHEAAITGLSTAQIMDKQNASGGMWAFAEGMEVIYLVVLFYLLWPVVFNIAGRVVGRMASPRARLQE